MSTRETRRPLARRCIGPRDSPRSQPREAFQSLQTTLNFLKHQSRAPRSPCRMVCASHPSAALRTLPPSPAPRSPALLALAAPARAAPAPVGADGVNVTAFDNSAAGIGSFPSVGRRRRALLGRPPLRALCPGAPAPAAPGVTPTAALRLGNASPVAAQGAGEGGAAPRNSGVLGTEPRVSTSRPLPTHPPTHPPTQPQLRIIHLVIMGDPQLKAMLSKPGEAMTGFVADDAVSNEAAARGPGRRRARACPCMSGLRTSAQRRLAGAATAWHGSPTSPAP
jgi:hypothetical protein